MVSAEFRNRLEELIDCDSVEKGSGTPAWILADYLCDCLRTFDEATRRRTGHYERLANAGQPET